jgi:hypothetical protein
MKTTIKLNNSLVELSYDSEDYEGEPTRVTRQFSVPASGGYVREWLPTRKEWVQVCDRLSTRGNTLHTHNGDPAALLALIRSEWQAKRRHDKAHDLA